MKTFLARRQISQLLKKNSKLVRQFKTPDKGLKVGVVFDASEEKNIRKTEKFRENLLQLGLEVKCLGFIPEKEFPQGLIFKPGFDFFNKKELMWNGLAQMHIIHNFDGTGLDYLIVANERDELILLQFAAGSKAAFRIGAYTEGQTGLFDFMVDAGKDRSLDNIYRMIEHYLIKLRNA